MATCLSVTVVGAAQGQSSLNAPLPRLLTKILPAKKMNWSSVEDLDVAGVKLRMSPVQVRTALKAGGFTPRATDPDQNSWSSLVAEKLAERGVAKIDNTKVPMFTMAKGPQGESIEVWYAATPRGAEVTSVKYQLPTNRMEKQAFISGVLGKYGMPTAKTLTTMLYCSAGETRCVSMGNKVLPYVSAVADYSFYEVYLHNGSKYREDYKAEMANVVELRAPKRAKATF